MKKATLLVLCFAIALPLLAEKSPVKPGKWEMTMQMDMPNMPFKMPPIKVTQCISKEDAENPENSVPKGDAKKKSDCKVKDMKVTGKTITYSVICEKQKTEMDAEMTYDEDTFTGVMKMKMDGQEPITTKYSGKRLGECDAK